jgi:hypothetical protein
VERDWKEGKADEGCRSDCFVGWVPFVASAIDEATAVVLLVVGFRKRGIAIGVACRSTGSLPEQGLAERRALCGGGAEASDIQWT